ncbi:MAG: DUF4386 family protein [Anaerolineae bacterium]|nr:DUF4386 family protein [Anaerolineae bacterium]
MDTHKTTARIVGALFLIAMVASLVGGIWLESIIAAPDTLDNVAARETEVVLGALLELINGLAVIGIAVLLFPLLKQQDEAWALGYVALRIIEAVLIIAALVIPLALVALGQEYVAAGDPALQAAGTAFLAARETLAGQMMGIFFGLGALVLFVLLYQSRLVPRFISVWGLIAAVSILIWNLLEMVGLHISVGMIFALPIILNEIFLGFWLIIKGFDTPAAVPQPAG